MLRLLTIITLACLVTAAPAAAQELVASSGDWRVFTIKQDGKTLCYIASLPINKSGNYTKRGEPYLIVTRLASGIDEVSVSSGYNYKRNSDVTLDFGNKKTFKLFTRVELAWAYDQAADKAIINTMIAGDKVTVRGTSWKGTYSSDLYSLKGFTAAHKKMKSVCK